MEQQLDTILGLSTCQCLLLWVLTGNLNKTTFTPKTLMEMLQNMLQYLMFLLIEHIMLTLTSITKNMLFRMCSPAISFHMNLKSGKPTYKFAQTCCVAFLPCIGLDSTYCLYYLVLRVYEQQSTYLGHSTWNWTVNSTCNLYLVIKYQQSILTRKLGTADDHISELCIELEALYFSRELF